MAQSREQVAHIHESIVVREVDPLVKRKAFVEVDEGREVLPSTRTDQLLAESRTKSDGGQRCNLRLRVEDHVAHLP
eukprot:CAMPEP_0183359648 /NCGR_PEP_ID=MMETSP0164_2-20130417/52900_1 /TAXON_ID=221442 /ORGANISM="Coccolithus pelagicus ssp braarudi, Strain PLY182g" /LENGTH=75 /DNA_ID=CAMNT_0025533825 /DNA_START=68 /DNA_END=292 /DNA_ORIENTATION=-